MNGVSVLSAGAGSHGDALEEATALPEMLSLETHTRPALTACDYRTLMTVGKEAS